MAIDLDELFARVKPERHLVLMVNGDKRWCDSCTLAPVCRLYRPESECRVSSTETSQGIWTDKFANGSLEALDMGLTQVLSLQAERVKSMIAEELPDDASPSDRLKHSAEIDKQLDKVFKNGMALRNARAPRALPGRPRDAVDTPELPYDPSPQQISDAMRELEELGYERKNIGPTDVRNHLVGQKAIAAKPASSVF